MRLQWHESFHVQKLRVGNEIFLKVAGHYVSRTVEQFSYFVNSQSLRSQQGPAALQSLLVESVHPPHSMYLSPRPLRYPAMGLVLPAQGSSENLL